MRKKILSIMAVFAILAAMFVPTTASGLMVTEVYPDEPWLMPGGYIWFGAEGCPDFNADRMEVTITLQKRVSGVWEDGYTGLEEVAMFGGLERVDMWGWYSQGHGATAGLYRTKATATSYLAAMMLGLDTDYSAAVYIDPADTASETPEDLPELYGDPWAYSFKPWKTDDGRIGFASLSYVWSREYRIETETELLYNPCPGWWTWVVVEFEGENKVVMSTYADVYDFYNQDYGGYYKVSTTTKFYKLVGYTWTLMDTKWDYSATLFVNW